VSTRATIPRWFILSILTALGANSLAGVTTSMTVDLMHGVTPFALSVREFEYTLLLYYRVVTYSILTTVIVAYLWPIIDFTRRDATGPPSAKLQRRVINAPFVIAAVGFSGWLFSPVFFASATVLRFGRWAPELASQQIFSPLVSGFLAATISYLVGDWIFRSLVVPRVFPGGRLAEIRGTIAPDVRTRLLIFLIAVAFAPLFTMLGLIRAAVVRIQNGLPVGDVVATLSLASGVTFALYIAVGIFLTLVVARTLARPLGEMVETLGRVQGGDLTRGVSVASADEVGILADGVNALVQTLRDKERILETFGRVVEPVVRDKLLAGELRLGGEVRHASVLFCDLRGFTGLAETAPPAAVVAMLNAFFTAMTAWVRECGGFVDKFIGDALLVVFGLFDPDPRDAGAAAALRCALGMQERLATLNIARAGAGDAPLVVAVSVHTGEVLAGRIGAEDRHEYTVIGDTVNVAARLQQLCKERGCRLLVSEYTYELARTHGVTADVTLRDSVSLRGRSEAVRVLGVA
jgi:adenylate cyclase